MFSKGDLIYIPQSANLMKANRAAILVTSRPRIGLFVDYHDDDGNWIMIGCDQAIFLPMIHKALMDGRKRIFLPMVCYHYNINLSDPTLFTCDRSKKQKYDVEKLRERGYIE